MQRAMTPAADMRETAPVDELVTGCGRDQQVTGGRACEGCPQPLERVRVVAARHATVCRVELERSLVAFHGPGAIAQVLQIAAGREPELADAVLRIRRTRAND